MVQHNEFRLGVDLLASLDFLRHLHQNRSDKTSLAHYVEQIVLCVLVVLPAQTVCGDDDLRVGDLLGAEQRHDAVILRCICGNRHALHLCHLFLADHDVGL